MTIITPIRYRLPLLTLVIFAIVVWHALFVPTLVFPQIRNPAESLKLSIETDKVNVVLGEPVYVTIRLKNSGSKSIKVYNLLTPQEGLVNVSMTASNGRVFKFVPLSILDRDASPVDLGPGNEVSAVFPIFYGARGWTFRSQGTYRIMATYKLLGTQKNRATLSASPLTVTVVEDGDGAGSFLLQRKASREAGKFLLWQSGDHLRNGIAHLENLLDKFPNSRLGDYVRFALGKNLSRSFKDYSVRRLRPPDCQKSLAYLQRVRDAQLPIYLQIQKNLGMSKCHIRLKQRQRGKDFLKKAKEAIRGRAEFLFLLEQVTQIERML